MMTALLALHAALLFYCLNVIQQFVPPCPPIDVAYKTASNPPLDTTLNEEAWILVFVYLLDIQSILNSGDAGFPKLLFQRLIHNVRLLPLT
jgi:hypothetical protein